MLKGRTVLLLATVAVVFGLAAARAPAEALTIREIQYTTDASGASDYDAQFVDCVGGVVTHKFAGSSPRLILQDTNAPGDPKYADGWAGIQVKDWTAGLELFNAAAVGDWVSLTQVEVEEYRGNTVLRYDVGSGAGVAHGFALPAHKLVTLDQIASPLEGPTDEWYVVDHSAELYEGMLLTVADVTVEEIGLGKAADNYVLGGSSSSCWAADYVNADTGGAAYHPLVFVGAHFESVSGILEQYTKVTSGWDYYQLLTTQTSDFVVPEPASLAILLVAASAVAARPRRRA